MKAMKPRLTLACLTFLAGVVPAFGQRQWIVYASSYDNPDGGPFLENGTQWRL